MKQKKKEITIHEAPIGESTEALVNTDFSVAVRKEKAEEILMEMISKISQGKEQEIKPFVIACKDGKLIVEKCIVNEEDGSISLPEIKMNSKSDIEQKSKFVRRIMKDVSPILKADIENVTYVALMRKDEKKLMELFKHLKKGKSKPRLQNRAGCIWLIIDDFEFII